MKAGFVVTDRKASGISEAAARSLRQFKTGFFNSKKVLAALDELEHDRLAKSGEYVRVTARRSMRKKKGKSAPGTPPNAHTEGKGPLLREKIAFAFDTNKRVVVVGSIRLGNSDTPMLHEHGGKRLGGRRKPRKVGDAGPVRIVGEDRWHFGRSTKFVKGDPKQRQVVYAPLKTTKQAAKATQIEEMLYAHLDRKFPPRPFVQPALVKATPYIERIFGKPL